MSNFDDDEDDDHFEAALRDPEPWNLADQLLTAFPDAAGLRRLAARLDEERNAARDMVEPLLESPERFAAAAVEQDPRFRTAGVVDVLNESARSLRDRQPQFALAVASSAVTLAEALAAVRELPSQLPLGRAHMERAAALYVIGRYREAEEALQSAAAAYRDEPHASDWDFAQLAMVRANIYVETGRLDEAREEAQFAAPVFDAFGDRRYFLAARVIEGHVLFMRRDYRGAAEVLDSVAVAAESAGDRLYVGRALQSAGNCYIELGEHERAAGHFAEALACWKQLGLEVERVRTEWSLGVLHKAAGDYEGAIRRIDAARGEFESLGIVNDAALTRLELAEVLLLADRPAEVPVLLENVVVSFTSEGVMHNARLALAYLREAAETGALEPRVIRHVRTYLEELPTHPTLAFIPPA